MVMLLIVLTLEPIKSYHSEPKKAPGLLILAWNYTSQKCNRLFAWDPFKNNTKYSASLPNPPLEISELSRKMFFLLPIWIML